MTAIPSSPQRSGSEAFMLHVQGPLPDHFRKGLEGDDRCDTDARLLPPRAAVELGYVDRQQNGLSGRFGCADEGRLYSGVRAFAGGAHKVHTTTQ
jgi:hypothetical protein